MICLSYACHIYAYLVTEPEPVYAYKCYAYKKHVFSRRALLEATDRTRKWETREITCRQRREIEWYKFADRFADGSRKEFFKRVTWSFWDCREDDQN